MPFFVLRQLGIKVAQEQYQYFNYYSCANSSQGKNKPKNGRLGEGEKVSNKNTKFFLSVILSPNENELFRYRYRFKLLISPSVEYVIILEEGLEAFNF